VPVLPLTLPVASAVLLSRQTNGPGTWENIVGTAPAEGAQLWQWNAAAQGFFDVYTFTNGDWSPTTPVAGVGEAVWIAAAGGTPQLPLPLQAYTVAINPGANFIANQLDHGSNRIAEVLGTNCPDGTAVTRLGACCFDHGSNLWYRTVFHPTTGWTPSDGRLDPGEGAILESPTAFTLTIRGTPHVPVLPVALAAGEASYRSRQTNGPGTWENIVGSSPAEGATVYRWAGAAYQTNRFTGGSWSLAAPVLAVGESAWLALSSTVAPPPIPQSYQVVIQAGQNLIANQLDHGSNRLAEVFSSLCCDHGSNELAVIPAGTVFSKPRNDGSNTWDQAIYVPGTGWVPDNLTLSPGEGAILDSPTGFTITFTGTPHVPVLPVTIPAGQAWLLSRQTNAPGTPEQILGANLPAGAQAWLWTGNNYVVSSFDDLDLVWLPSTPVARVGEAMWIAPAGGSPQLPPPSTVTFGGFSHTALGNAGLTHSGTSLVVANLGTNGTDGVAIALPNVMQWSAQWEPLDPNDTLPAGTLLRMQAVGSANSVTNGLLHTITVTKTDSNAIVAADFSPLGVTNITVRFYNGTNQVGEMAGLSTGPVFAMSSFKIIDLHIDMFPPYRSWLTFFGLRLNFLNAPPVDADSAEIIPQGVTIARMPTAVLLQGGQIPALVITNEFVSPSVLSAAASGGSLTLQWLGTGRPQESADFSSWTTLTNATSPYVVPMNDSNRFYRLWQPVGNWNFSRDH
jgi:hypothetical protein